MYFLLKAKVIEKTLFERDLQRYNPWLKAMPIFNKLRREILQPVSEICSNACENVILISNKNFFPYNLSPLIPTTFVTNLIPSYLVLSFPKDEKLIFLCLSL